MRESAIENSFSNWCKQQGHRCVKLAATGSRGFPDRTVFLAGGGIVFIEFKKPGGVPSFHQKQWIDFLRERGFVAGFAWSRAEAIALVEKAIAQGA
jgi:hypothetical protein